MLQRVNFPRLPSSHSPSIVRPYSSHAVISGEKSIAEMGEDVLDFVIKVASGEIHTKAEGKGQEDFIPWDRGISF
jgi:altronate dehydratase